jgi:site-specific recombinase XerD
MVRNTLFQSRSAAPGSLCCSVSARCARRSRAGLQYCPILNEPDSAWVESGLVFTRENGAALHPEYVSRHFEHLTRDGGLPPVRLHDLRHGAATLALAGGADLKTVSEMLGHSTAAGVHGFALAGR